MNLYLVRRKGECGYDEFDSQVVMAETEDAASKIYPSTYDRIFWDEQKNSWMMKSDNGSVLEYDTAYSPWVLPSETEVFLIGVADPAWVQNPVITSFNAG